jgi:hypothetical protein
VLAGGGASAVSGAALLAAAETQALALDFTDDFFEGTSGLYGSAYVLDTGTPANNYNSHPYGLLTYTSPSLKMTMGPDGLLRFGAHNLCLQSENFATTWANTGSVDAVSVEVPPSGYATAYTITDNNDAASGDAYVAQTITTVSGLQYSGEFVLKAGTDTWALVLTTNPTTQTYINLATGALGTTGHTGATVTDLTNGWYRIRCPFTSNNTNTSFRVYIAEANGDFTLTRNGTHSIHVTGAHLRRTPSDDTYLATTSAARYALPHEWDSNGNPLGILVEEARTNLCLHSSDLTNAAWIKSSLTTAKTATGPDGVANSATTITATAANATALQNIVSASAARSGQWWLKRRTGTGAVSVAIGETTGSELVTNGEFGTDTDWTKGTGWTISAGVATGGTATTSLYTNATNFPAGKLYRVTFTVTAYTSGTIRANLGANVNGAIRNATGTYTEVLYPVAGDGRLYFVVSDFIGSIDNVTCTEVAESTIDLSSGEWVQAKIENKTITNPCSAIKLATSGDAVDVALCGVENGAFVTSPIPTLGSTVTRAADNISLATSAFPWSATANTLYLEGSQLASGIVNGIPFAMTPNGTNRANVFVSSVGAVNARVTSSGGAANPTSPVTVTQTNNNKYALSFSIGASQSNVVVNGTLGTASSPTGSFSSFTGCTFGAEGTAGYWNGHIRTAMLRPRRVSDADMQTETAP